jgi:hypothetical protein
MRELIATKLMAIALMPEESSRLELIEVFVEWVSYDASPSSMTRLYCQFLWIHAIYKQLANT